MSEGVAAAIEKSAKDAAARGVRLIGIFGNPVAHTLSPSMHNAAFRALGLNFHYEPFEVPDRRLAEAVETIRKFALAGANVTVPHKETVIGLLDSTDEDARKIGAVNTIVNESGRLCGRNTDAYGFLKLLEENGAEAAGKTVFIVGAGGAARSVAAALAETAAGILVTDTDRRKAKVFAADTGAMATDDPARSLREADILVNATPVGMKETDGAPIDLTGAKKTLFVCDLVYNRKTRLLRDAGALSLASAGGLGMLLHQGAKSFEMWTGRKAPVDIMKKALEAEMARRHAR